MSMYGMMYDFGALFAAVICVTLLIFIGCMRSFDSKLRMQFLVVLSSLLVAIVAFVADDFLATISVAQYFRYITKILKEVAEGFIAYQTILIIDEHCTNRRRVAYALPFVLTTIIYCCAPLSSNIFSFDANNNYIRGNLGYLVYAEVLAYAIEIFWICIKKWMKSGEKDAGIVIAVVIETSIAVALEETGVMHGAILASVAIGVCFLYMYMFAVRYNVDSVTSCYKRRCFYSDAIRYGGHTMAIISMDLNDLKLINDTYGHMEGDKALRTFADTCRKAKDKKFLLYRTGGDEFMMLGIRATKDEAKAVVEKIKKDLEATEYSASFGVVMYRAGDDFDEMVVKADKAMYSDKKEFKIHNKRARGRT